MTTIGFADLKDTALPSLWDLAEIKKLALADGSTFDQVVRDIISGMQVLNGQLLDMPNYGGLFAVQDNI